MYMFFFLIHLINVFVGSSINLNKNTLSDFLLDMNVKYGNNDNTMDRIRSKGVPGEIGWARIQQDTDDKTCDHADMIRIMQFGICQQYEAFASRFVEYVSNDGGMDAFNISTYVTADCTESPVTVKYIEAIEGCMDGQKWLGTTDAYQVPSGKYFTSFSFNSKELCETGNPESSVSVKTKHCFTDGTDSSIKYTCNKIRRWNNNDCSGTPETTKKSHKESICLANADGDADGDKDDFYGDGYDFYGDDYETTTITSYTCNSAASSSAVTGPFLVVSTALVFTASFFFQT